MPGPYTEPTFDKARPASVTRFEYNMLTERVYKCRNDADVGYRRRRNEFERTGAGSVYEYASREWEIMEMNVLFNHFQKGYRREYRDIFGKVD